MDMEPVFEGAIFDQDGLLFDTEIIFERSWKKAGREFGVTVPGETWSLCGQTLLAVREIFSE